MALQKALTLLGTTFQVDMDGRSWKSLCDTIQHFSDSFPVANIEVQRDTLKRKHYHIKVTLAYPYPTYMLLIMRELMHDDSKRHYLDAIRLFDGYFADYDWLATLKYDLNLITEELTQKAQYITCKTPPFTRYTLFKENKYELQF